MAKIKILVVEDSKITASLIKKSLERLGYAVSALVVSGEEAIKKAEEDKHDLVLMDIVLEGKMDGIETAGIIRSRSDIPVIYLTSHAEEKTLNRAKTTEPFGFITKPFEDIEIRSNIEMALYKHRAERERKKLIQDLQDSLTKVKLLSGLLPICASCKSIRDDKGYWKQIESYIKDHSEAEFSHSICPECAKKLYPDMHQ